MTKKDFVLIAATIRAADWLPAVIDRTKEQEELQGRVADAFADKLAQTNPAFKRDVFLKACGVSA